MSGPTMTIGIDSGAKSGDSYVLLATGGTTKKLSVVQQLGTKDSQSKLITLLKSISRNTDQRIKDGVSVKKYNALGVNPTSTLLKKHPVSVPNPVHRAAVMKTLACLIENNLLTP